MVKEQKTRALWWQYPSLSDAPAGPWSYELARFDNDPMHHWQRAIRWMAENGVNVFIGNLASYSRGIHSFGCNDWPFPMVCTWPEFPEARIFPLTYLELNRNLFNEIIEEFHRRNIRVFLHHYNFFAPYRWFIRQPDLVRRKNLPETPQGEPVAESAELLAKSVCPNSPVYQNFMKATWAELFRHLPDLDGLLITLGESNRCPCPECTDGVAISARWDHAIQKTQLSTFSAFASFYVNTLNHFGKEPMLRCWHGGADQSLAQAMPKGPVYVIKYSGFNSIDCDPDPIHRFWTKAGHRLWVVHEVSGSEPAGPCTWLNPQWVADVNERAIQQMSIEGSVAFHNNYMSRLDRNYAPIFFNMEAALQAFRGLKYDPEFYDTRAVELLGTLGKTYLKAGELYSRIVLNIDKVVSYPSDGMAFCFNIKMLGDPLTDWPGVLGELGPNGTEPQVWTRKPVAPLRRYREYLQDHPWASEMAQRVASPDEIDPIAFLEDQWKAAKEGLSLIEAADLPADSPYQTVHQILYLSARWAVEFGRFWVDFIRAKVFWWGAQSLRTELVVQTQLARQCICSLEDMVAALEELYGIYYRFPEDYIEWGQGMNRMTFENKLAFYRTLLRDQREYFRPLIEDKVFRWPTVVHFPGEGETAL